MESGTDSGGIGGIAEPIGEHNGDDTGTVAELTAILGSDGTGTGNGDIDSGTGRRNKRGRPKRNETGVSDTVTDIPVSHKRKAKQPPAGMDSEGLSYLLSGGFAAVASIRGEHWSRTPIETLPLASPTAEYLNQLDAKAAKKCASILLPLSIVIGAIVVVAPAIKTELEVAQRARLSQGGIRRGANEQSPNPPENRIDPSIVGVSGAGYSPRLPD